MNQSISSKHSELMSERKSQVERYYASKSSKLGKNSPFDAIIERVLKLIATSALHGDTVSKDDIFQFNDEDFAHLFDVDGQVDEVELMKQLVSELNIDEPDLDQVRSGDENVQEDISDDSGDDSDDDDDENNQHISNQEFPIPARGVVPCIGFRANYKRVYCANPTLKPEESFELRRFIARLQMKLILALKTTKTAPNTTVLSQPNQSPVIDPVHYPTAVFLRDMLVSQQLTEDRCTQFVHTYEYLANTIEYFSKGQLTIQPFGSVPMGLGSDSSDLDTRLVLNPAYSRIQKVDTKHHYQQNKQFGNYEGPLPSVWATTPEIPKEFYNLPVLQVLDNFAVVHFMKKLKDESKKINLQSVDFKDHDVKLFSFTAKSLEPASKLMEMYEKKNNPQKEQEETHYVRRNNNKHQRESKEDFHDQQDRADHFSLDTPVDIDIVSSNDQPMAKTEFVRSMIALSPYTHPLLLIVKQWAKQRGILGATDGYLNSFSFVLLVIFFLQISGELPTLHKHSSPNPHIGDNHTKRTVESLVTVENDLGDGINTSLLLPNVNVPTNKSFIDPSSPLSRQCDITPLLSPLHQLPDVLEPDDEVGSFFDIPNYLINDVEALHGLKSTSQTVSSPLTLEEIHKFTCANGTKLWNHQWCSPMTGEMRQTFIGGGNISDYTRYMKTHKWQHKFDSRCQYKLEGNILPDSPDLPHRYSLYKPFDIFKTLPPHCIAHVRSNQQLIPSTASLYINHSVAMSLSDEEKREYFVGSSPAAIKERFANRLWIPTFKIPQLPPEPSKKTAPFVPFQCLSSMPTSNDYHNNTPSAPPHNSTPFQWSRLLQLLGEFFYFYGFIFNPDLHVISVRNGHLTWLHEMYLLNRSLDFIKMNRICLYIEDPFNPLENSAKSITTSFRRVIMFEFQRAAMLMAANGINNNNNNNNNNDNCSNIANTINPITPKEMNVPIMNVFAPLSAETLSLYHNYLQLTEGHMLICDLRNKKSQVKNLSNLHKFMIGDLAHQCCFNSNLLKVSLQSQDAYMRYTYTLYGKITNVTSGNNGGKGKEKGENITFTTVDHNGILQSLLSFNHKNTILLQSIMWDELQGNFGL